MIRKVLVVVDMQNDFITGALGTKEAQAIVPKVVEKIKEYQEEPNGETVNIFATRDTHYESYLNTSEGKNLPVEHCIRDTEGWELNNDIKVALDRKVGLLDKNTFGSLGLANDLSSLHNRGLVDTIELVGVCTDICVVSNALLLKAYMPEVAIIVDASCCAGVTPESHQKALDTMKMCQIKVINETEDLEI